MDRFLIKFGILKPKATNVERVTCWFSIWGGALLIGTLVASLMDDSASAVFLGQGAVMTFVGLILFNWGAGTQGLDEQERRDRKLDRG